MTQAEELSELQELLATYCRFPEMYVGVRSIERIDIYFWAYAAGRSYGNTLNLCQYIRLFGAWLASRHRLASNISWHRMLLQVTENDEDRALEIAPILFAEFVEQCGHYERKDWFDHFGPFMRPWADRPSSELPYNPSPEKPL